VVALIPPPLGAAELDALLQDKAGDMPLVRRVLEGVVRDLR
jgi:hypothetical protein